MKNRVNKDGNHKVADIGTDKQRENNIITRHFKVKTSY
jgi:hypothetical protein